VRRHDAAHGQLLHLFLVRQQHRLRLIGTAKAALTAGVLLLALAAAPGAAASVSCSHSGAPDYALRIFPYENPRIDLDFAAATVRRSGSRLLVVSLKSSPPVHCSGSAATVFNTDSIVFIQEGLNFGIIDLTGGPLAPGKTAEEDGSNEIEAFFQAERASLAYGVVTGTKANDDWVFGGSAGEVDLRLDQSRPEEADVLFTGHGKTVAVAEPGSGNDHVDATAIANPGFLTLLDGGPGADVLLGSRYRDSIDGGPGRDLMEGGPGADQLLAGDRNPEEVLCGPGRDRAVVGKGDKPRGCEKVSRSKRRAHSPSGIGS
jgi:hypothetical protein